MIWNIDDRIKILNISNIKIIMEKSSKIGLGFLPLFTLFSITTTLDAATVVPGFSATYTLYDLGSIAGLPTNYGGLVFKHGDPNTIIIGGNANANSGRFYEVPVTRGAGNHITSFGSPVQQGFGAHNDGGISYAPNSVLFYSKYNIRRIGQVRPGQNSDNKISDLAPLGVAVSPGSLTFVPTGSPGAGRLKVSSYSGGQFYDITYTADGNGSFDLGPATQILTLPGGPEGMIYAPSGSPDLNDGTLLVTEYNAGKVAAYDTDANGNPILNTRQDFVTGLTGGEGAAIDPVTGDFLFSTFGGGSRVIRVEGFQPPPPQATVNVTSSANPSVFGVSIDLDATVTGNSPTGSVDFQDGSSTIAGCTGVPIAGGVATCTTSTLPVGTRYINAIYNGDANNSPNNGNTTQTILPANIAPIAGPTLLQTYQGNALNDFLVANDADGDSLTFSIESLPSNGTLTLDNAATGAITYTPGAGFTGTDTFTYKVNDSQVDSNIDTGQVTVFPVPVAPNVPPLAGNDVYHILKNTTLFVGSPGIIANDLDPDGGSVTVSTLPSSGPSQGVVTAGSGGGFTYVPTTNYVGLDSFDYEITDGTNTVSGTVGIVVLNTNSPPLAGNDSYTTPSNTTLNVPYQGLLINDSDPDGNQPLSIVVETMPNQGSLALTPGGGFTYTPNIAICSSDSDDTFTYRAYDGALYSNLATVTIHIHCTNQSPVATGEAYSIAKDVQLAISAPGILANDFDPDGNSLSVIITSQPSLGAFAPSSNGGFYYTSPTAGSDSFTYKVTDGAKESAAVTTNITVTPTNVKPLASGDTFQALENTALNVGTPGVLVNDFDPEGHPLTTLLVTQPTEGHVHMYTDGTFSYTPTASGPTLDSFTYKVNDGDLDSDPATVEINIAVSNAAPIANDDAYSTNYGEDFEVIGPGMLVNDTDADLNQPLQAILASQPASGTIRLTTGGGFKYHALDSESCQQHDSFTYYANDSVVNSDTPATVSLNITCPPPEPVPTLTDWGRVLLLIVIGVIGLLTYQRQVRF